jgi:hypothetical protein
MLSLYQHNSAFASHNVAFSEFLLKYSPCFILACIFHLYNVPLFSTYFQTWRIVVHIYDGIFGS